MANVMARGDDSLLFCNLPPRKSVTGLHEQPRLSYYNGNELQAVPFKWEASPGKPIVANASQQRQREEAAGGGDLASRLPLPPGASPAFLSSRLQRRSLDEIERPKAAAAAPPPPPPSQQKLRLPPKTRAAPAVAFAKPGHRRSAPSNESVATCARSDFDWPEVSDDEEQRPCTPPCNRDAEAHHQHAPFGRPPAKEEYFSSGRSSDDGSNSMTSSSPVTSGGSGGGVGGSARDLLLWRNLVRVAATPSAANAVPFKPPPAYSAGSVSEDDDAYDNDHAPSRGLFSCMPIFSRVRFIQSQLSKCEKDMPGVLDFSNRLTPGLKNKVYRC